MLSITFDRDNSRFYLPHSGGLALPAQRCARAVQIREELARHHTQRAFDVERPSHSARWNSSIDRIARIRWVNSSDVDKY